MQKGQITIINLVGLLIALFLYFALLPVLNSIADSTVSSISSTPNEFTTITIAVIYFTPFAILVMIILTGLNYAIPGRYGVRTK